MREHLEAIQRRVVFDTSTLVGAALRIGSTPHRALEVAIRRCVLCASDSTLAEIEEVLSRSKFDRYQTLESRLEFATMLRRNVTIHSVLEELEDNLNPSCRDLNDNKFLALAASCGAMALISSDVDLLSMHPWNGVPIISPATFIDWIVTPINFPTDSP